MNRVSPDSSKPDLTSECLVAKLPDRRDFLRLRSGKRYSTSNFTLQAKPTAEHLVDSERSRHACRVGYTVTTKVGNAVVRNRIRRRLKSAVSEVFPVKGKPSHDYALIARRKILSQDFAQLKLDLQQALDRIHSKRAKGV
ncbi:MAG: ribonuclease P protein component [Pseudomonadota bacterium]